ncbi:MAG: TRAP transporter large permease subunit, partial [Alphaproteobacteria bacterium]
MELVFLAILFSLLIGALASGYPVAFALPGSALITIFLAALSGYMVEGNMDAYFTHGGPIQWLNAGVTNFRGIYWEIERDTLIAIPLFVFMGIMLQRSKIAEDLLVAMAQLFGPVPGGLGIAVVFVGALLAATTGIVGATVIAMGLISLPVMLRHNYSVPLATGTINASGTLGQIIPPSIVLIILADQLATATDQAATLRKAMFKDATGLSSLPNEYGLTSTSAGEMFLGALLPGMVLVGLYMLYILVVAIINPKAAPPVPYKGKYDLKFAWRIFLALVPPLTLIFAVLGSIILGVATVNQAGAIGAIGAMIMAGYRLTEGKRGTYTPAILAIIGIVGLGLLLSNFTINIKSASGSGDYLVILSALVFVLLLLASIVWSGWRAYRIDNTLKGVMVETAKTTSLVFIILLGAAMLTAAFRAFGGEDLVRDFLTSLPGGFITKFIVVMSVIFFLGFFLDFIEIAVVVVPIIAPILLADPSANITGVWLGVMIGVNIQTSFLTPPFGFALFYMRGVAPKSVKTTDIYRGVVPFIVLQLIGLAIVGFYPSLVNYLPTRVSLTAKTAPPLKNPRLQLCIEKYVFARYDEDAGKLPAAIEVAKSLDLALLPEKMGKALTKSFSAASATPGLVSNIRSAEKALALYAETYRPVHRQVRETQVEIRSIKSKLSKLDSSLNALSRSSGNPGKAAAVQTRITGLETRQAELEAQIPAGWETLRKDYLALEKAAKKARTTYRRNVDNAYEPVATVRATIAGTQKLASLEGLLRDLGPTIKAGNAAKATEAIKKVEAEMSDLAGTNPIRSRLRKVRRALKGKKANPEKAGMELIKAIEVFATELSWRQTAA